MYRLLSVNDHHLNAKLLVPSTETQQMVGIKNEPYVVRLQECSTQWMQWRLWMTLQLIKL